jgi:hypothetical protein
MLLVTKEPLHRANDQGHDRPKGADVLKVAKLRLVCTFDGCEKFSHAHGLCGGHYEQESLQKDLTPLQERLRQELSLCSIEWCSRVINAKGLCAGHYNRQRKGRDLDAPFRPPAVVGRICSYPECERPYRSNDLCSGHFEQRRRGIALRPIGEKALKDLRICEVGGCEEVAKYLKHCRRHYRQEMRGVLFTLPTVRGGWKLDSRGYVIRSHSYPGQGRRLQFQHRAVMEEMLGRRLIDNENVHHINGVRHDNRPENLELWNTSQPAGQRVEDKANWAEEILRLYRPEALVLAA